MLNTACSSICLRCRGTSLIRNAPLPPQDYHRLKKAYSVIFEEKQVHLVILVLKKYIGDFFAVHSSRLQWPGHAPDVRELLVDSVALGPHVDVLAQQAHRVL